MRTTTGIELGPDSCVLVRARTDGGVCEVAAVHVIPAGEWPADPRARVQALRAARRAHAIPRRARVVVWEAGTAGETVDVRLDAALRPVRDAGFRVEAVLSPAQALAAMASERPRPGPSAVAWLSINTHGLSLAIVRGRDVLASRSLGWSVPPPSDAVRSQLLYRYSLVAHIAPALAHAMSAVRQAHGVTVETVVTCGNLPDLRSLTMPLIEELDLEVETLDSSEGLRGASPDVTERVLEFAPVIRLACGAATAAVRPAVDWRRRLAAAALVVAVAGGAAMVVYTQRSVVRPVEAVVEPLPPPIDAASQGVPTEPVPLAAAGAPVSEELPAAEKGDAAPVAPRARQSPGAAVPGRSADPAAGTPLPRVTSILIGEGRRLAIIDGDIRAVGDSVGSRVLVRIDEDAVVLRDRAGVEVRVPLRPGPPDEVKFSPFAEGVPVAAQASPQN
ncbi:MAG TPA: hypothetical protein VM364_05395 [Vicinamibacterales bacterium]|nr:hypothetical protein [Vicinamibacterales bacterium]